MNNESIIALKAQGITSEAMDHLCAIMRDHPIQLQVLPQEESSNHLILTSGLNELSRIVHQNAVDHGFWENDPEFGTLMALIHSEVSEALEHSRNGLAPRDLTVECKLPTPETCPLRYPDDDECLAQECKYCKPDGIPAELADAVIRVLDVCGRYDIDIGGAIFKKMAYNKGRPIKHGKEF